MRVEERPDIHINRNAIKLITAIENKLHVHPGLAYLLDDTWVLWKIDKDGAYESSYTPIYSFSTIAGYCEILNEIKKYGRYIVMRWGHEPYMEFQTHRGGYHLTCKLDDHSIRDVFENFLTGIVLCSLSKTFDTTKITGITYVNDDYCDKKVTDKGYSFLIKQVRLWIKPTEELLSVEALDDSYYRTIMNYYPQISSHPKIFCIQHFDHILNRYSNNFPKKN